MKPMKKRMLQDHTIQDALAFWQLLRRGRFRPLLAEPTENTIIQLFRYVITGASSFLVDFLLLFLLELAGLYYLPGVRRLLPGGNLLQFSAHEVLCL